MAGLDTLVSVWAERFIRVAVALSLIAHVLLAIFAGIRRRQAYGVRTLLLWFAYQVADWATPFVLSSSSLEQHLVALWLPFIVMHLGGPDNITAYSWEDNKFFLRLLVGAIGPIGTIVLLVYKQEQITSIQGLLFWASLVMVVVAVCKYAEKVLATNVDLGDLLSSSRKKKQRTLRIQPCRSEELLSDEKAQLLAHELLDITKQAFADEYLGQKALEELKNDSNLKEIFSVQRGDTGWNNMRRVVEMELSLMYDILYTKAAMVHTWHGYTIRIISPIVTATVILLYWLYSQKGQSKADAIISYSLMAVTFLLDVRWLLRAAASTWTYDYFNSSWLHHEVCCTGRWRRLRHFVASLDPWQLPLLEHGSGYRLWSGTIGQYNLFDANDHGTTSAWLSCLKTLSLKDAWMDYKYSNSKRHLKLYSTENRSVKELLFKQIQKAFNMEPPPPPRLPTVAMAPALGDTDASAELLAQLGRRELDEDLDFLPEIQELILIWHVTTEVFLRGGLARHMHSPEEEEKKYVTAIEAVSNYMAFLAAVRSEMLPGLKRRSLPQSIGIALEREDFWSTPETGRRFPVLSDGKKFGELLTEMLGSMNWQTILDLTLPESDKSRTRFQYLIPPSWLNSQPPEEEIGMLQMLELLLSSWVRLLIYVSIRCSREAHAKQLGRGCELTTVVWILFEHAMIFAPKPPRRRNEP